MNIQWFRKLSCPVDSYFSSLLSILYDYLNEERSWAMEKAILANIPDCLHAKSQA
jgi:hypothetical protein